MELCGLDASDKKRLPKMSRMLYYHKAELQKCTEAGLLNKSSCLAPALGVTKLIIVTDTLLCSLSRT